MKWIQIITDSPNATVALNNFTAANMRCFDRGATDSMQNENQFITCRFQIRFSTFKTTITPVSLEIEKFTLL